MSQNNVNCQRDSQLPSDSTRLSKHAIVLLKVNMVWHSMAQWYVICSLQPLLCPSCLENWRC